MKSSKRIKLPTFNQLWMISLIILTNTFLVRNTLKTWCGTCASKVSSTARLTEKLSCRRNIFRTASLWILKMWSIYRCSTTSSSFQAQWKTNKLRSCTHIWSAAARHIEKRDEWNASDSRKFPRTFKPLVQLNPLKRETRNYLANLTSAGSIPKMPSPLFQRLFMDLWSDLTAF